jgi:hypothetical protein
MNERRLAFVRTNERADAYIKFFESLNKRLKAVPAFPSRHVPPPKGASWQVLAFLNWIGRGQSASLFATFTRNKEMRIELYLDCGTKELNKQRFDELLTRKSEIESMVGEPLVWERRDENRACRIAITTKARIQADAENPALLDWSTQKAVALYKAFTPEFPSKDPT